MAGASLACAVQCRSLRGQAGGHQQQQSYGMMTACSGVLSTMATVQGWEGSRCRCAWPRQPDPKRFAQLRRAPLKPKAKVNVLHWRPALRMSRQ